MSGEHAHHSGFQGPKCWVLTAIVGLILGAILSFLAPANYTPETHTPQANEAPHDAPNDDAEQDDAPLDTSYANEHLPEPITLADAGQDAVIVPDAEHPDTEHAQADHASHGPAPSIPLWLVIPFALLLLSIAVMPFVNERFWHAHYPDFAFILGGIIIAYYFLAFGQPGYTHGLSYGHYNMMHTGLEYYSFIALIGGLFVASGGVLVDVRGRGGPVVNTALLGVGAIFANVMGTTGASVLLIQPFLRINKGRLSPIHVVMFIFIISNCGGSLTPIGDPPSTSATLRASPSSGRSCTSGPCGPPASACSWPSSSSSTPSSPRSTHSRWRRAPRSSPPASASAASPA